MGTRASAGFTIIETMLFLAVTAVMVGTLLVGFGASLNTQRYRDSLSSFKAQLQNEYAYLSSVQNLNAGGGWTCDAVANPVEVANSLRGQSDCMMVGRYITVTNGSVATYTVLAREVSTGSALNDVVAMQNNYVFNIDRENGEYNTLEWGTSIAYPRSGTGSQSPTSPRSLSMMIVRSPETGQVYTFSSNTAPAEDSIGPASLRAMVTATAQREQTVCINPDGLFTAGDMSVYIAPYANTGSAVEIHTNAILQSLGKDTRC